MGSKFSLKDLKQERRLIGNRIYLAGVFMLLLIVLLLGRIFYLQIIEHNHYTTLSRDNQVQIRPLPPIRGLIFSSDNVLLADNRPSFSLDITPEKISGSLNHLIARLRKYIRISKSDIRRYKELAKKKRRFERIPLRLNLTDQEVAIIAVNQHLFSGVDIVAGLSRYYPVGPNLEDIVGYVGRIDKDELSELDASEYSGTSYIGKLGAEKAYESILHGHVGYEEVEVNVQGRVIRQLDTTPPVSGKNIYLTVNVGLQNLAVDEMAGRKGAIVALDPRDGSILALVSAPGYDPNPFVNGIDPAAYRKLLYSKDTPLLNRAIQGTYPPGSTIKPFLAFTALNDGVRKPDDETWCPGWYKIPGTNIKRRGWVWFLRKSGHGHIDMTQAIAQSCDIYFYKLATDMGINRMDAGLQQFGFGEDTGIDIGGENSGLLPSPAWKRKTRGQPWYPGDTVNVGIGQGNLLVTPIQLARAVAAIANRGTLVTPHLLAGIQDPVTNVIHKYEPPANKVSIVAKKPEYWDVIINAMNQVVDGAHGTARASGRGAKYKFAGKTGTAQVYSLPPGMNPDDVNVPEDLRDHALFIAFAPLDNPTIAVSVIVEHGAHGASAAAPIARHMFDYWLSRNKKN